MWIWEISHRYFWYFFIHPYAKMVAQVAYRDVHSLLARILYI